MKKQAFANRTQPVYGGTLHGIIYPVFYDACVNHFVYIAQAIHIQQVVNTLSLLYDWERR